MLSSRQGSIRIARLARNALIEDLRCASCLMARDHSHRLSLLPSHQHRRPLFLGRLLRLPERQYPAPITIDLAQGKAIDDWSLFFKPGFLGPKGNHIPPLMTIYLRHAHLDKACLDIVNTPDTSFDLWLDSRRGLMAQPSLPHVVRACASLVAIPFTELQDAIRDPSIRADLQASSRQAANPPGKPLP